MAGMTGQPAGVKGEALATAGAAGSAGAVDGAAAGAASAIPGLESASDTALATAKSRDRLSDLFGRSIQYLRLSVTDRCDFRCEYCMAEEMRFLPRSSVLSLEELYAVGAAFVDLGVTKIRLTGGEPLVRKDILRLVGWLAALPGLQELCLTTNGARLEQYAAPLREAGLDRLNISLDSLNPVMFRQMTRTGDLGAVLRGIEAARAAGFRQIKLNCVVLRGRNSDEVLALTEYAISRGLDITFIEEMPLGKIDSHDRAAAYVSSAEIRQALCKAFDLVQSAETTGGPARYWRPRGVSDSRIGFISPHSENFCASCNRVRVTAEGKLLLCLGNEHSADLRAVLRGSTPAQGRENLRSRIRDAIRKKPERHHFSMSVEPEIVRFMNMTGG